VTAEHPQMFSEKVIKEEDPENGQRP